MVYMTDSMFKKCIAEVADAFVAGKRDNGKEFYKIKDDAPEWLRGPDFMRGVHAAVDNRLPDDWIYEHTMLAASNLGGYDIDTTDHARDSAPEVVDGLVDVYNNERYQWLASHMCNADLCDEAQDDRALPHDTSMADRIGAGQALALERICYAIIDAAQSEAESREDDLE